jgi:hypothetical protein
MKAVTRRDVVKFAAAASVAVAGGATAIGQERKEPVDAPPPAPPDSLLALAVASPQSFALGVPVTFRFQSDGHSRDLVFTQVLDEQERQVTVHLRSGTVRIFRADAGVDDFTKRGGLRWEFFDQKGEIQLETPGAIVMAVRENDRVRCYTMTPDYRC